METENARHSPRNWVPGAPRRPPFCPTSRKHYLVLFQLMHNFPERNILKHPHSPCHVVREFPPSLFVSDHTLHNRSPVTMAEFLIQDEDLTSLKGKVVIVTGKIPWQISCILTDVST